MIGLCLVAACVISAVAAASTSAGKYNIGEARAAAERLAEERGYVMSQADVKIVMGFFDAYNTGDGDAFMSFFAPSVEALPDASVFPESGPCHGHEDLKRFFE
jgi:hypothetical protein